MKDELALADEQVTVATITEFSKENHVNLKRRDCASELYVLISFEWRECIEEFKPKFQNDFGSSPVGSGKIHSHRNFVLATADLFASLIISQQSQQSEDAEELDPPKKIKKVVFIKTSQLQRWNLAAALGKEVDDPEILTLLDELENKWDNQYIPLIKEIFEKRGVDLKQVEMVFLSWKDIMALPGFKQGKQDFLICLDNHEEVAGPFKARKDTIIKLSEKESIVKRDDALVREYLSEEYGGILALTRNNPLNQKESMVQKENLSQEQSLVPQEMLKSEILNSVDICYPQALPILKGVYEVEFKNHPTSPLVNCCEIKLSRLNIKEIVKKKNFFPIKSNIGVSWNHEALKLVVAARKIKYQESDPEITSIKHQELSEPQIKNIGSRASHNVSAATQLAIVGQNLFKFTHFSSSNFPSPPNSPPSSAAQDLNTLNILMEQVMQRIKANPSDQLDPNFKKNVKMLIKNTNELGLLVLDSPEKTNDKEKPTGQFVFLK